MVTAALEGENVVRLKGGDPFIFGRGGEEVENLQAAGIRVSVINGITSGLAAVTSLNVPLTHREHAHGVVFVTGHAKPGDTGTDWRALAHTAYQAKLTLVIYMGVSGAAHIQDELLYGLPDTTPWPSCTTPACPRSAMQSAHWASCRPPSPGKAWPAPASSWSVM